MRDSPMKPTPFLRRAERMFSILLLTLSLPVAVSGAPATGAVITPSKSMLVYFGTYTGKASKGIYVSHFDTATGALSTPQLAVEIVNPSFLALHPNGRFLYAVNEIGSFKNQPGGAVSAFAIHPETGQLTLLNQRSTRGGGPCHLTVDPSGKALLVANYGGGSIAALPIADDGELDQVRTFIQHTGSSVNPGRQSAPHAHGIYLDNADRFAFVPDLGVDRIFVYRWNPESLALEPNDPPFAVLAPGSGPRHFALHPNGRFAYVINELLNTVTAFSCEPETGILREIQTVPTLPTGFSGQSSTAEIVVHPTGRFLYGSNRGHDSLAFFGIDLGSGQLKPLGHEPALGRTPRSFTLDPTGGWLLVANQDSSNVTVFSVDARSGALHSTGRSIEVPSPVCVLFR